MELLGAELGQQDLRAGIERCQGVGASLRVTQLLLKSVFRRLLIHDRLARRPGRGHVKEAATKALPGRTLLVRYLQLHPQVIKPAAHLLPARQAALRCRFPLALTLAAAMTRRAATELGMAATGKARQKERAGYDSPV